MIVALAVFIVVMVLIIGFLSMNIQYEEVRKDGEILSMKTGPSYGYMFPFVINAQYLQGGATASINVTQKVINQFSTTGPFVVDPVILGFPVSASPTTPGVLTVYYKIKTYKQPVSAVVNTFIASNNKSCGIMPMEHYGYVINVPGSKDCSGPGSYPKMPYANAKDPRFDQSNRFVLSDTVVNGKNLSDVLSCDVTYAPSSHAGGDTYGALMPTCPNPLRWR